MNSNIQIDGSISFNWIILLWLVSTFLYLYFTKSNKDVLGARLFWISTVARSLVFLILLLILNDTNFKFYYDKKIPPKNYIFIDNSKSMAINDGVDRKKILEQTLSKISNDNKLFKFGEKVTPYENNLTFNEKLTDFNAIFDNINLSDNISSIVILSDGCNNTNSNPIFNAQKYEIPVITVGIGNPNRLDFAIDKILAPDISYLNEKINITVNLAKNTNKNSSVDLALFNDDVLISSKKVDLKEYNTSVNFTISFSTSGVKNLNIKILNNDADITNNIKGFSINVLNDYKKIVCITGSPSNDFGFVVNAIKSNPKNKVSTITIINNNKILENIDYNRAIDSADAIVLVGFPSKETPQNLLDKVNNAIATKSLLYVLSYNVDFNKLKVLVENLPFSFKNISDSYLEVVPSINDKVVDNQIYGVNKETWEQLPPINYNATEFEAKSSARVLSFIKNKKNIITLPLIIEQNLFNKRNLAILGSDIWKWKLLFSQKNINIFDEFMNSSLNWIAIKDNFEKLKIKLDKTNYNLYENVNISAYLYDDARNPVDGQNLKIYLKSPKNKFSGYLTNYNAGLYTYSFEPKDTGNYYITVVDEANKLSKSFQFYVSNIELEMSQKYLNQKLMLELANSTNGKYFNINNIDSLYDYLKLALKQTDIYKKNEFNFNFLSSLIPILLITLLLSVDWFLRRRNGLL